MRGANMMLIMRKMKMRETYVCRTFTNEHSSSGHDLLVSTRKIKVVPFTMSALRQRDMARMGVGRGEDEVLEDVRVWLESV